MNIAWGCLSFSERVNKFNLHTINWQLLQLTIRIYQFIFEMATNFFTTRTTSQSIFEYFNSVLKLIESNLIIRFWFLNKNGVSHKYRLINHKQNTFRGRYFIVYIIGNINYNGHTRMIHNNRNDFHLLTLTQVDITHMYQVPIVARNRPDKWWYFVCYIADSATSVPGMYSTIVIKWSEYEGQMHCH